MSTRKNTLCRGGRQPYIVNNIVGDVKETIDASPSPTRRIVGAEQRGIDNDQFVQAMGLLIGIPNAGVGVVGDVIQPKGGVDYRR